MTVESDVVDIWLNIERGEWPEDIHALYDAHLRPVAAVNGVAMGEVAS